MALDTIKGLREKIAQYLERDDLAGQIDDFIRLAEARHRRDIRIKEMVQRASLSIDDQYVSLPTDTLEVQTIRILTSPITILENVSLYEMNRRRRAGTGKPSFYTIHGSEIEFDIDVDQTYSGEIVYFKVLTALDDTNTSNDLLTIAPDAYLYAALLESAPFLMDDPRIQVWSELYAATRDGLNQQWIRTRSAGPQFARAVGSNP